MSKQTNSVLNFVKRNAYYLIIGFALLVTAVVIFAVLYGRNSSVAEVPTNSTATKEPITESPKPDSTKPIESEESDEKTSEESDSSSTSPTEAQIVFTMPVKEANVIKNYTSATVVYNKTLGVYTGHMGIDFSAEAGAQVVSAYAGKVESVRTSYLEGTTITIDHGDGLKTVYNSVEADESIVAGKMVSAGQVIGTVSDNNRQEYKDGPHLHFETILNGLKINPETYLMLSEK